MSMIFPMFFYTVYIIFLGLLTFRARKNAVMEKKVSLGYMRTYKGDAPENIVVLARHFDNQFQMPMLFFITCLSTHIFIGFDMLAFVLAWVFIATRIGHSYVHLNSNNVIRRALFFFAGVLVVLIMWFNVFIKFLMN